tara:strand:- start:338 stop:544 length:207 start_codon:yes stop_codon:yes gene_type:complete
MQNMNSIVLFHSQTKSSNSAENNNRLPEQTINIPDFPLLHSLNVVRSHSNRKTFAAESYAAKDSKQQW